MKLSDPDLLKTAEPLIINVLSITKGDKNTLWLTFIPRRLLPLRNIRIKQARR